jgi:hypothetical protein
MPSKTNKTNKTKLSDRSMAILWQGKTDMITPLVIYRRHFANATPEAARSALRRLSGDPPDYRFLRPQPLSENETYYLLTREGTKLLGISPRYAEPLRKQGKIARYAVSWFIHAQHPGKRVLFDPQEFTQEFGIQRQRLPRHPYFIDETTGQARLGLILVDHNAQPRRIIQKTIKPLARFLRHGWFDEFFGQGNFLVAVLTFNTFRQRAFQQKLPGEINEQLGFALSRFRGSEAARPPVEIQVQVVPRLDQLVALPEKGARR